MKSGYIIHLFAIFTAMMGLWIFVGDDADEDTGNINPSLASSAKTDQSSSKTLRADIKKINPSNYGSKELPDRLDLNPDLLSKRETLQGKLIPEELINQYRLAWQDKDNGTLSRLWEKISQCEKCLALLVEQVLGNKFEEGMQLELAIKMAALNSNIVLPVFDYLIDPAGSKSTSIILTEKLILNGRPEFVTKIFDVIYQAKQNGYDNFARQMTWVISKLNNPEGVAPILDTIAGRKLTSPEFSDHVTNVFSKVVRTLPESSNIGHLVADYYLQANSQEQQKLWSIAKQHGGTLVTLAVNADKNGQHFYLQKYADAIVELPHLTAVDSLMQLHTSVEYSPDYLGGLLSARVADNPTIKVLHKLEDYMRNPNVKIESRIFAAEGLLAVRQNRQARYILEKVINNTEAPDAELQAYIGGRL